MQQFFVIDIIINDPGQVTGHLNQFYQSYAGNIDEVINVTHFVTAKPDKSSALAMDPRNQKLVYEFHFVITYTGKQIIVPGQMQPN